MSDTSDLDTFRPARTVVQHGDHHAALVLLHVRYNTRMVGQYDDPADPRHDIAVLAVDVASRLVWLHHQVAEAAATGAAQLQDAASRAARRSDHAPTPGDDITISPVIERLPQLAARVEELEYTLSMVCAMFRAAWATTAIN